MFAASCLASPYHGAAVSTQYHTQDSLGQYSYGYADPNSQKHETRSANGVTQGAYSYVDGHGLTQSVKYSADDVHGFNAVGTNIPVGPSTVHHPIAVVSHAAHHSIVPASTYAHAYSAPIAYSSPLHYAAVAPAAWSYASATPAWSAHHGHYAASPIAINPHGVPHDTPEVAAAKIAHFAAHAEANANHHHLHKRSLWGGHAYAAPWAHAAAPVIHNGVPVDTPEVQHAKAAHFAAHAAASHGAGHYAGAPAVAHHYAAAPAIHNGHPVDTPEVQHAKAAHFAAVAEAQSRNGAAGGHYDNGHYDNGDYHSGHYDNGDYNNAHYDNGHDSGAYIPSLYESADHYGGDHSGHYAGAVGHYAGGHGHGAIHIPVIKNGVPVETPEVQHAKAAHFAAVAEAQSRGAGAHHDSGAWNHYDGHGHHQW